ncbi:MAG TPA: SAM-dependent chlorinase/fluorinase [Bacteroidales bacterium]|nr:SAM-dependent chlorinase/fluorinase [Bacteroidales bacterium]HPI86750.1 SAM-dependent chlorinase/fluorinase [Bacteroidales bacterium]HPM92842.1 SAM-dependent chlorinase/fluorinase [Bacteroidales bacterium]
MMPIITLTSDWGQRDYFLAAMKGKLMTLLPEASIVDISHEISPFNLKQASFVIRNSYPHFPKGTVHVLSVLTEMNNKTPHLAVQYDGQYFIAADNGIFSLIFDKQPEKIIRLSVQASNGIKEKPARDRFIEAAVHLASGKPVEQLGEPLGEWREQLHFHPVVSGDVIRGVVIYVNRYENVITNITKDLVEKTGRGRNFIIEFRGEIIKGIKHSYQEAPIGEIVALFGSTGHLEIAINQGNASSLLGLDINDPVRVEFKD